MPSASVDTCRSGTGESSERGGSSSERSTAAGAVLGLIATVLVTLNAPAIGAAAAAHANRAFVRPIPQTIKPFRSVDGVRLGFTVAQVNRRFGRPEHRFPAPHRHLAKYDYDDENFEVGFGGVPLRVIWVATYRRQDHTPQGLRVDYSTLAQARGVYRHSLHCSHGSCTLYDHGDRSRPHMTFEFSELGHRLGDIELSVAIDRLRQLVGTAR